uniref:Uncharacterized protein n=1 Tax=Picea glauca TaxID=3330 RepID=A0A101LX38_PICGL|nr:hypothetical protein ABT39_MTgene6385 [Picea glauca]QHR86287.1 hypothetical protein Q903MT_gene286 [Picea sitchensis]
MGGIFPYENMAPYFLKRKQLIFCVHWKASIKGVVPVRGNPSLSIKMRRHFRGPK